MLRKLVSVAIVAIAVFIFSLGDSALADSQQVLAISCKSCHSGGLNPISPDRILEKENFEKHDRLSENAMFQQDMKGIGAMPLFSRVSETTLREIAAYMMKQAKAV